MPSPDNARINETLLFGMAPEFNWKLLVTLNAGNDAEICDQLPRNKLKLATLIVPFTPVVIVFAREPAWSTSVPSDAEIAALIMILLIALSDNVVFDNQVIGSATVMSPLWLPEAPVVMVTLVFAKLLSKSVTLTRELLLPDVKLGSVPPNVVFVLVIRMSLGSNNHVPDRKSVV